MASDPQYKLEYDRPASNWYHALPVGNGRLGGMIFGGARRESIQLNEDTLWGGGPYDPSNPHALASLEAIRSLIFARDYDGAHKLALDRFMGNPTRQASYQPVGEIGIEMLDFDEYFFENYNRSLDLDSAVASVSFTAKGVTYERRIVASPSRQVIAIHLTCNRKNGLNFDITGSSPQPFSSVMIVSENEMVLAGKNGPEVGQPGALRFEARVRVVHQGGGAIGRGDHIRVQGADEATIFIAMATSYRSYNDVGGDPSAITLTQVSRAIEIPFEAIASETTAAHRELFRRVNFTLGDQHSSTATTEARLEAVGCGESDLGLFALYYQFGRYLLITSSRPGSQPANLQGIWNNDLRPSWGSKYTININLQMNYWPAESANLPELVEPLVRLVEDLAQTGTKTAKRMYGARGWVAHHNTDLWRATAPIDGPQYGLWPCGGAWLLTNIWEHFQYSNDIAFLERVYPLFVGASLFFIDTLVEDPATGFMVDLPTMSPENLHGQGSFGTCAGPTSDIQILRDLFTHTCSAAEILQKDSDLVKQLRELCDRLQPTQIGKQGQIREWAEDWDAQAVDLNHRHTSHLYALYPSSQIDVDTTPDLAAACRITLDTRGDPGTGWATAWRLALWARLRDGEKALEMATRLLTPTMCYPNLFDAHPPLDKDGHKVFQIDGNLGAVAGINEMIVQSHGGKVVLLPALPKSWSSGSLTGIRLRGGWETDLSWSNGLLSSCIIRASQAGRRPVQYGAKTKVVELRDGETVNVNFE